ncbi:hypothetical protein SERLADRAFT_394310 [Serpula lacrymans var. lacrymans S7.9]|uniref:Uncharacterized protein n=1 Tax=Serpula lacrymans var. lacrymans (strain S7.9) TaxID=578457 RepID=F8P209_SERL9|nr:uncharacterized protein SERLADRAFT_394310 [Serpula lacrymans var. lacrymans S7.9]EGO23187.1 hypothetical protein SERLADRAFT_394310 [Serpula lacrymans var. lacrymans S7.9]
MQPGIYKLVNCIGGSAMDLSGGDYRSIIGFPAHDGDNQKVGFPTLSLGFEPLPYLS